MVSFYCDCSGDVRCFHFLLIKPNNLNVSKSFIRKSVGLILKGEIDKNTQQTGFGLYCIFEAFRFP